MLARPSHNHNCRLIREGIRSTHALYGRLDLALITGWDIVDAGRELVPLLDEELNVALPARHSLARRTRVPVAQLRTEVWIGARIPTASA
jgi:DNA-binding transcriptional LysR family regulator